MLHNVLGNPHTNVKKKLGTTVAEENVTVDKVLSDILTFIGQTACVCPVKCNASWKKGKVLFHAGSGMDI
jgi:nickel-dependent lactate racemase